MFARPRPEQYLLPNERRVLRTRRHWAILVPNILLTIVILAVLVGVNTLIPAAGGVTAFVHSVLWYSLWVVLVRLALIMADWWDDLIIITDERILNVTGLFASRMKDTPIKKITDRDIRHSIVGNLLGYGTITIESAGHASLQRLRFVPEPLTVFEAIAKLTSKAGLPPPASGEEQTGPVPSIEQESAEWPAGEES
jgi:uncharacterized membrane protein YdbT with pleckstrin-like domain